MPRGRPLLRRLRLPFRHERIASRIDGAATADQTRLRLIKAVAATGRLRPLTVVLAEGLEPSAARLRGECSGRRAKPALAKIDKRIATPPPDGSNLVSAPYLAPRPVWTFTMSKSAAPPAP